MLYEVITGSISRSFVAETDKGNWFVKQNVITSYSIHYTKLYESLFDGMKRVDERAIGIKDDQSIETGIHDHWHTVCKSCDKVITARLLKFRAAWFFTCEARITSYNVCYTKLLRFPVLKSKSLVSTNFTTRARAERNSTRYWSYEC